MNGKRSNQQVGVSCLKSARFYAGLRCRVVYQDVKPTNGEFIALIADKLKMDKSA